MFRFKQFSIIDDNSAMKVGMDSVLLGSWAHVDGAKEVLDIGSGCGILCLMVAQRNKVADVVGVEISEGAVVDCEENFRLSQWSERLKVIHKGIEDYDENRRFGCIISNPPYFNNKTLYKNNSDRVRARHTHSLTFKMLIDSVVRLLADDGCFSLILPTDTYTEFSSLASDGGLFEHRKLYVSSKPNKEANRVLLEYRKSLIEVANVEEMCIRFADGRYSKYYSRLTNDFYLDEF